MALAAIPAAAENVFSEAERIRRETRTPGVLIAMTDGAEETPRVWSLGTRGATTEAAAIHPNDHCYIGSVSKLFVGSTMLHLIGNGRVCLDDKLSRFLPDYRFADKITIGMLGSHTSGVGETIRQDSFQQKILADPSRNWSLEALIGEAASAPQRGRPGGEFSYSNVNSVLLAAVIENVTGRPYADALQRFVLQPMKLDHTGRGSLPAPKPGGFRHGKPDRWLGYGDVFQEVSFATPQWAGPAGDLYSTLDDLTRALPQLVERYRSVQAAGFRLPKFASWDNRHYGFQIEIRPDGFWGHAGNVPGFSAAAWHHPEKHHTVVVLCNLSNAADGSVPAESIANVLIREVLTP